jgi:hypothetical protein
MKTHWNISVNVASSDQPPAWWKSRNILSRFTSSLLMFCLCHSAPVDVLVRARVCVCVCVCVCARARPVAVPVGCATSELVSLSAGQRDHHFYRPIPDDVIHHQHALGRAIQRNKSDSRPGAVSGN